MSSQPDRVPTKPMATHEMASVTPNSAHVMVVSSRARERRVSSLPVIL